MFILVRRKTMIKEFANEIANIYYRADKEYYKPHLKNYEPIPGENEQAAWILDQVNPLNRMCRHLRIIKEVYEEAYKIYDFRNSGKKGYVPDFSKIKQFN